MAFPINMLLGAFFLAIVSAAQAADVPTLKVERMCHEAAAADPTIDYSEKRCVESEHEARDALLKQWREFPAKDRQECTEMATMGGSASYVELLTCLEMNREARKEQPKMDTRATGLNKQQPSK